VTSRRSWVVAAGWIFGSYWRDLPDRSFLALGPDDARSAEDPGVRSVKGAAARAPRLGPDPVRNREAPRCGRA